MPESIRPCPACGHENRRADRFCSECGGSLAPTPPSTCPSCGWETREAQRFCGGCGKSLGGSAGESAPPASWPTSIADGRYRIERAIGAGSSKRVFVARDTRLDREVALALVETGSPGVARAALEVRRLARLGPHPNVVGVYDTGTQSGFLYIVEEYMTGGDLAAQCGAGSPLPLARTLSIAKAIGRALEFVHASGLIHRDVKPANVFFAEDGTPKLGDFGLATALDQTRITQQGAILGTAAYIPPEQALGGEVTDRSDLYSFGTTLYEMVSGRLPFVADDPTAIISQHINTPPVAPSWHTDACPDELEELILRLLAKRPEARPSATEALDWLARVEPRPQATTGPGARSRNPLERVARRTFVGRDGELSRLRSAFDRAFAGNGAAVLVCGETGIGKTRLLQELDTYARTRGAHTLWGRNHEDSGAPAYWPWIQIGGAHEDLVPAAELATDIGRHALRELARIHPPLRELVPDPPELPETEDPGAARFRMFDAYTSFLRAAVRRHPLLVVIDDLHWADEPSIALFQHLSREAPSMRLLVAGTYRESEIDRGGPLERALLALNSDPSVVRLSLGGLSEREVESYIRDAAGVEPPGGVIRQVHTETAGNPLFFSEFVNLMAQDGKLSRGELRRISLPEGMLAVLGRRLARLPKQGMELLRIAAVIGHEFSFDALRLFGYDEQELLGLLEQALDARVIEETERPGRYRFTHTRMHETVLSGMSNTRRARLHGEVGETLERRYGERAAERAGRLARHFVESAGLRGEHREKAYRYSKLAAEHAESVTGWLEAASHYERCLALLRDRDLELQEDEADVLAALGRNQNRGYEWQAAHANLMRAVDLYRARGDLEGMGRAVLWGYSVVAPRARLDELADEVLHRLDDGSDPRLRALLAATRAELAFDDAGEHAARLASAICAAHELPEVSAILRRREGARAFAEGRLEDAAEIFGGLQREAQLAGNRIAAVGALERVAVASGFLGRLEEMERLSDELLGTARERHLRVSELLALIMLAANALARAEFQRLERLVREAPRNAPQVFAIDMLGRVWRGGAQTVLDTLPPIEEVPEEHRPVIHAMYAIAHHHAGRPEDAARLLQESIRGARTIAGPGPRAYWLTAAAETAALVEDPAIARPLYEGLARIPTVRLTAFGTDVPRGSLALLLGRESEAERHFRTGLAWAEREGAPLEVGRCEEGLARIANGRGDLPEALRRLDRAARLFHEHGARRLLERAIGMKLAFQGTPPSGSLDLVASTVAVRRPDLQPHTAEDGTVSLVFCDLADFTPMTERLGDLRAHEMVRTYVSIVRNQVAEHAGHEVELQGDGFLLAFQTPRDALRCAAAIHQSLRAQHEASGDPELRARIGAHAGEVLQDTDRFFGLTVIVAARVAALARGGETLVSSRIEEATRDGGEFRFGPPREVELKGISEKQRIFNVEW